MSKLYRPSIDTFHYTANALLPLVSPKIKPFANITTTLIRKVFEFWEAGVLVIYYCVANYSKFNNIKQQTLISQFLWGRNPGVDELGVSGSVSFKRFQSSCWLRNNLLPNSLPRHFADFRRATLRFTCMVACEPQVLTLWAYPQAAQVS